MKLIPEVVPAVTEQDYARAIEGVQVVPLQRFVDHGGSMTELTRLAEDGTFQKGLDAFKVRQVNFSTLDPGIVKAFHVHMTQRDVWFVPPEDRVLLVLVDVRDGSKTAKRALKIVLGGGRSVLVAIPPGVAHGCKNIGDGTAHLLYMTDVHFSPEKGKTDEHRLPWDMAGAEIWEPAKD
ncbi:MAG TPA: dTDP-4-dehydrorhamnose 3,5-epimerase family protein [Candidatus Polarisedimenticolaceae bacterium]|nr:dTDP-4-dehydrorhamnose 3,5-epimerase family protein [Candidatus Polarisedimenticolaceae bacterium]